MLSTILVGISVVQDEIEEFGYPAIQSSCLRIVSDQNRAAHGANFGQLAIGLGTSS